MTDASAGQGTSLVLDAPAKINLALHVVGQRADGHHLLESLVTFADRGDRLSLFPAEDDRFTVSGAFGAAVPLTSGENGGNLVLRARDLLRGRLEALGRPCGPVHLHLEKALPVASGIGGGSADAAAALAGLLRIWNAEDAGIDLPALGLSLGADLPMCLAGHPLLARGIGEAIAPVAGLPAFPALLVNPGVAVSTPVIFRALLQKTHPPLVPPDGMPGMNGWIAALAAMRNDLEPPARLLAPVIGDVSRALALSGAALARMSGSGATCFGLYPSIDLRDAAAHALSSQWPDWYVLSCNTRGSVPLPSAKDP